MLLARLFEDKGVDVKLIERDAARCEELADILDGTLVLHGDGTDKALLEEENVGKMDVVAAVTGDEETNILSCLLAKSLGVRDTVASVNKAAYLSLMELIGIDHSVSARVAAVNGFLNYIRRGRVVASGQRGRRGRRGAGGPTSRGLAPARQACARPGTSPPTSCFWPCCVPPNLKRACLFPTAAPSSPPSTMSFCSAPVRPSTNLSLCWPPWGRTLPQPIPASPPLNRRFSL